MLKGYLDGVTSSGYVEGWAFDPANPFSPVSVTVRDGKGREIGHGLAHRYREDLALVDCAGGWCAFRLRVRASVRRLWNQELTLLESGTGTEICRRAAVSYVGSGDPASATVADVVAADPTVVASISQLGGCEEVFARYLAIYGVDAFVRVAYLYVVGRAADASSLETYGSMIRKSSLSALRLLEILSDNDEFRCRTRLLAAPNTSGFPFG